jgi:hypothetical protein
MIRRRAAVAGISCADRNHVFRATGIAAYLGNGGTLEHAQCAPKLMTIPGKSWS